jgi:hypothetical protein
MDELVELCVLCPIGADVRVVPSPPVEIIRYGRPRWWAPGACNIEDIASEITSRKVQILHAMDAGSAHLVRRLADETKIDYVVSSFAVGDGRRLGKMNGRARAVLAASEPIQKDLLENRVLSPERIYLVRPGVVRVTRPTCFDTPENSLAVVAGGPMDDFICFEAVLRAFAELKSHGYDCVYFVIGQGRAERRLRARAKSLGLMGELTFVERQPPWQLTGMLKSADVYIAAAPAAKLDFQSLLAMASGVPVLSVSNPVSDFLKDAQTTLQFARADASELTAKLLSLLNNHDAARSLVEKALDYLRQRHAPADMSARMAEIYRQVIAEAAADKKRGR